MDPVGPKQVTEGEGMQVIGGGGIAEVNYNSAAPQLPPIRSVFSNICWPA